MIEGDETEDIAAHREENPEFLHLDFTPRPEIDSLIRACFIILHGHYDCQCQQMPKSVFDGIVAYREQP
jgi:hypothetical protein